MGHLSIGEPRGQQIYVPDFSYGTGIDDENLILGADYESFEKSKVNWVELEHHVRDMQKDLRDADQEYDDAVAELPWLYHEGHQIRQPKRFRTRLDVPRVVDQSYVQAPQQFAARLIELESAADEAGIEKSAASETCLSAFMVNAAVSRMPIITLRPNGDLRAVWKNNDGEQVGIQFESTLKLDYVIFSKNSDGEIEHHLGKSSEKSVLSFIHILGLQERLFL